MTSSSPRRQWHPATRASTSSAQRFPGRPDQVIGAVTDLWRQFCLAGAGTEMCDRAALAMSNYCAILSPWEMLLVNSPLSLRGGGSHDLSGPGYADWQLSLTWSFLRRQPTTPPGLP
jgi:hypothetical protein